MIYVSLAGFSELGLQGALETLSQNGIQNIELSGAFPYYDGIEEDLLTFKKKYNLNYLCHNYFPHPAEPFVLNLASLNDDIYTRSLSFLKERLKFSKKMGSARFGFHAGFFIDIGAQEVGKPLGQKKLFDRHKAMSRFCDGFNELKAVSEGLELYLENNVLSHKNFLTFNKSNPLMMATHQEYEALREKIKFKLLLDVAHLKVSSNSLGLDFKEELKRMMAASDYLHISDNDGFSDQNKSLAPTGELFNLLSQFNLKNKIMTLEINEDIRCVKDTFTLLNNREYQ